MDKLLIEGRYSGYKNSAGQENIPIERKKDLVEDASWYNNKADSILFAPDNGTYETRNSVIQDTIGDPTNPIVKELLYAEYQYQVDKELMKAYKKKGWLEDIISPVTISSHGTTSTIVATTFPVSVDVKRRILGKLHDEELLQIMFLPFKLFAKDYYTKLKTNFTDNKGVNVKWDFDKWPNRKTTHLDQLLTAIKDKIYIAYLGGVKQDITPEI
jgi:hypothetical protein